MSDLVSYSEVFNFYVQYSISYFGGHHHTMGVQSTVLILSGLLGLISTTIGFASLLAYHLQESEDSNKTMTPKLKINIKSDKTS